MRFDKLVDFFLLSSSLIILITSSRFNKKKKVYFYVELINKENKITYMMFVNFCVGNSIKKTMRLEKKFIN